MSCTNVERLHAAGVIKQDQLNDDQKKAINCLSEEETNELIIIASKVKANLKNSKDHIMAYPF